MVSGGPDSATLAKVVEQEIERTGKEAPKVSAIYLRTGESSDDSEIEAASRIVEQIGGRLEIIDLTNAVSALGGSRLLIHSEADLMPFGNGVALSIAMVYGLRIKAARIMIALHADDAEENVEYTRGFIDQVEQLARFGQSSAPSIETPFINMNKSQVFKLGLSLGVDYARTWSCIRRGDVHCGICGACRARRAAFVEAEGVDPTQYETEPAALGSLGTPPGPLVSALQDT
jgi:7-cyano-7-deazaguanine synthase